MTDPLTTARRALPSLSPTPVAPSTPTPTPTPTPVVPQAPSAGLADTRARPGGRRIAAPADRRPDGPGTGSMEETGSHARITEPIADPPPPPSVPASGPAVPAAKVKAPQVRRRTDPRPKVAKPKVDRPAARAAARQARAATAAPAARQASLTRSDPSARPGATSAPRARPERRTQERERPDRTALIENETWLFVLALGAVIVGVGRAVSSTPDLLHQFGGVLVSCSLAWGLATRTGGRPLWATSLTAGLGVAAVLTQWSSLMSGAAIGTGVLAAVLAVMMTVPAATYALAIRETLVATAVAWIGGLGVLGYGDHTDLRTERFGYVVFALALVAAIALVYRLGAGLHGLGRRGYAVAGSAMVLLFLAMAYTEAISQWGSRELVDSLDEIRTSFRSTFGAVAHPIMALLGYPALVWGVFMRARRRQGWWVCAFGVAATASSATRLVAEDLEVSSIVLGEIYSMIVGFFIGYLMIRIEQSFTGSRGRRARRDEEAVAHRPEPRRTQALH